MYHRLSDKMYSGRYRFPLLSCWSLESHSPQAIYAITICVGWFLSNWHKLRNIWERILKKWLNNIDVSESLQRNFLINYWFVIVKTTMAFDKPRQVILSCLRKQNETGMRSKLVSSTPHGICFNFCFQVLPLSFLIWLPQWWTVI